MRVNGISGREHIPGSFVQPERDGVGKKGAGRPLCFQTTERDGNDKSEL